MKPDQAQGDDEAIERIDERAHKLVGASLFLLAAYIAVDAVLAPTC